MQVIPHITDEIKRRIRLVAEDSGADVVIVEIGGTVGDIESLPFLEAIRQMRKDVGAENTLLHPRHLAPLYRLHGGAQDQAHPAQRARAARYRYSPRRADVPRRLPHRPATCWTRSPSLATWIARRSFLWRRRAAIYEVPLDPGALPLWRLPVAAPAACGRQPPIWRPGRSLVRTPEEPQGQCAHRPGGQVRRAARCLL